MPERGGIAAVVLAAGRSSRYGADKLLQPLTLEGLTLPLAAHSLRPWLHVFPAVTVVVRPQSAALRQALGVHFPTPALRWVECAQAGLGMGHSLAAGVAAEADAAGWLIGLADMPLLPVTAIAGVCAALAAGAPLAAAYTGGRRGHPVGFAIGYRDELLALAGDAGARGLLQRDALHLTRIQVDDAGILADIDSPADLNLTEEKHQ